MGAMFIGVQTRFAGEVVDITEPVQAEVADRRGGSCHLTLRHTTAGPPGVMEAIWTTVALRCRRLAAGR